MSLERQQELFRPRNLGWGGRQSDEHYRRKEQESQGPQFGQGMASSRSYEEASAAAAREQNRSSDETRRVRTKGQTARALGCGGEEFLIQSDEKQGSHMVRSEFLKIPL